MSSAAKTLELLGHFSVIEPEMGLSRICQLANRDKATTYRHLQTLEDTGFIEQNSITKQYRLGPALLQLAQIRELTVPRKSGAIAAINAVAETTGETAHVSVLSGSTVYPLVSCESQKHGIRVVIDVKSFPLHATSSGICALAFGPSELMDVAKSNLEAFTATTIIDVQELDVLVEKTRKTGFGRANGSFEEDVFSLAAPLFDQTGLLAGSVSVATVSSRFTPKLEHLIKLNLIKASREISRNWGGIIPQSIESCWAEAQITPQESKAAL